MSLVFVDGCDHASGGDTNFKWDVMFDTPAYSLSGGMFGQGAYQFNNRDWVGKHLSNLSSVTIGFGYRAQTPIGGSNIRVTFNDNRGEQITFSRTGQGIWSIAGPGELGRSSQPDRAQFTWRYIELHIAISDNTGPSDIQMMLDGQLWIDGAAGQDTNQQNTGTIDFVAFGASANISDNFARMDDIYILTSEGPLSTFLGPIRIDTLWPTSEGTDGTDFTPFVGASAALDVDERSPNDGTDYIHASVTDDFMTFNMSSFSAISQTDSIHGVAINFFANKIGGGARRIGGVVEASGTSFTSLSFAMPIGWINYQTIYTSNPSDAGTAVWAVSEVCAASWGVVITL